MGRVIETFVTVVCVALLAAMMPLIAIVLPLHWLWDFLTLKGGDD